MAAPGKPTFSEWSYSLDPGTRHVGPMIQALLGIVEDQRVELARLKARVSELESTKSTEP